ncbi:MAG: hypothetical protein GX282_03475 [Campylobacteraceae bacterium]|nr:hypothetical protein [Campylobacteraceae bacterium]
MKSPSFAYAKSIVCGGKEAAKFVKKSRIRRDRRATKQILKHNKSDEKLPNFITINSGAWNIV